MTATGVARTPRGVPTGGEFAAQARTEADLDLVTPALTESSRGCFEVVNASTRHEGSRVVLTLAGIPHRKAQSMMAAARIERSLGRDVVDAKLHQLAGGGKKATVLIERSNGDIQAKEGTLRTLPAEPGSVLLLNKGSSSKGEWLVRPGSAIRSRVVDVVPGYGQAPVLAAAYRATEDRNPALVPATVDDLPMSAPDSEPPSEIAAVYVLTHPGFEPGQDGRGTVFFATDQQPGEGPGGTAIVNGFTVAGGASGLVSEHGSWYASDLQRFGGRVDGYEAGSHTFEDAWEFGDRADRDNDIEACWDSVKAATRP